MTGFAIAGGDTPYLHHAGTSSRVRHGFFGAAGGVSSGVYASLNCGYGSDDNTALVANNRGRVADAMGLRTDRLAAVFQVHGADAVVATDGAPSKKLRSSCSQSNSRLRSFKSAGLRVPFEVPA